MIENRFPHVFQPLTIRGLTLKNRLQYAPTVALTCAPDGSVIQDAVDYVSWQADTGVAYVTVGDTPVYHNERSAFLCELDVNSDDCIPGMHRLVRAARAHGAELSVELSFEGRAGRWNPGDPPLVAVSASRPFSGGPFHQPEKEFRDADADDREFFKGRYVDCAVRCKNTGFKMVMLHCGHGNFLAQWLSPLSNARTDEYGGSPENRRRYPLEVLKAVREAVGKDILIEIRVSASEEMPGGLDFPESLDFMEAAEEYVDIIHISRGVIFDYSGSYTAPSLFKGRLLNVKEAAEAKKRLSKAAVCVVGVITSLEEAEEIIATGKADIVAMAKSLMTDQHLVRKSLEGRIGDVRPCTRCDLCGNHQMFGTPMTCMVNPRFKILGDIESVAEEDRKKVLIIGGGPAGMMAAQTATARGHFVTLYEKSDRLGGLLNDATQLPFKEYMRLYLEWDKRTTESCGARIKLKTEATAETIKKEAPDAVIVATGSHYLLPQIPGIDLPNVVPVREADAAPRELGAKAVVCGGGLSGLECALALAQEGKEVTVIDLIPADLFGAGMPVFNRSDLLIQLEEAGVILRGNLVITAFTEEGIEVRDADGATVKLKADNCVNALGVKPDNALGLELLAMYPADVYLVGDCVGSGKNYGDANHDAYNAAMRI